MGWPRNTRIHACRTFLSPETRTRSHPPSENQLRSQASRLHSSQPMCSQTLRLRAAPFPNIDRVSKRDANRPLSAPRSRTSRAPASPPITPLKLPRHVKTVVVFGGSFDPPHHMHVLAPLMLTQTMFGDTGWLLYVPAARSPHKSSVIASDEHRLAMLRYAIDIPGQRSIWTDELDRAAWARERGHMPKPSFTIDTLHRLRKILPARVKLRLLIGSDQVGAFHKWKEPREIIKLAEPLIMMRPPAGSVLQLWQRLDNRFWTHEERLAWLTRIAPSAEAPMSSTELREAIPGAPKSLSAWSKRENLAVTEGVARHIIRYNLYDHRPGAPRPLDPRDMPPAPVGNYPRFAERVIRWCDPDRGQVSDAQWAKVFRKIDPKNSRSQIPAYARPVMKDAPKNRTRKSKRNKP